MAGKGSPYLFSQHLHMSHAAPAISLQYQAKLHGHGRDVNLRPARGKLLIRPQHSPNCIIPAIPKPKTNIKPPKQALKHLMVTSNIKTSHGHIAETKSQISKEMLEHLCAGEDEHSTIWMQGPCFKAQDCPEGSSVHAKRWWLNTCFRTPFFIQSSTEKAGRAWF